MCIQRARRGGLPPAICANSQHAPAVGRAGSWAAASIRPGRPAAQGSPFAAPSTSSPPSADGQRRRKPTTGIAPSARRPRGARPPPHLRDASRAHERPALVIERAPLLVGQLAPSFRLRRGAPRQRVPGWKGRVSTASRPPADWLAMAGEGHPRGRGSCCSCGIGQRALAATVNVSVESRR